MELFGFEIAKKSKIDSDNGFDSKPKSFVAPENNDGAIRMDSMGNQWTTSFDFFYDTVPELLKEYWNMAADSDIQWAINEIVNEAIVIDEDNPVKITFEDSSDNKLNDKLKKIITAEFGTILDLMDFNNCGDDLFRRWYINGREYFHIIVDENNLKKGIRELRWLHPASIKKIKVIDRERNSNGVELIKTVKEVFHYSEIAQDLLRNDNFSQNNSANSQSIIEINPDVILYFHSGIYDNLKKEILSYLHQAIRPYNQLKMLEDSVVIYRVTRAPERRVFYIDVGNLPKTKAEQYIRNTMNAYKNKMIYDSKTGKTKDGSHTSAMIEDIWLARRADGRSTEVTSLPGGQSDFGMEDLSYFKEKLYRSLGIPPSRLNSDTMFVLGRSGEITRDEVKFTRLITSLRSKYSIAFRELLQRQLIWKGFITPGEWPDVNRAIKFIFNTNSHFAELKEIETRNARLEQLNTISPFVGQYFSKEYVMKEVLRMNDDEIKMISLQMKTEKETEPKEEEDAQEF